MDFEGSLLLAALAPATGFVMWGFYRHGAVIRTRALSIFFSDSSRFSSIRFQRRREALLVGVASILLACTLLRPVGGIETGTASREGRDVLVMLDVSLSMLARDHPGDEIPSTRFDVAKMTLEGLVEALSLAGGHRLSLVVFAGRTSLLLPPALDYNTFLARIQETGAHDVSRRGTRLGEAIATALAGVEEDSLSYTDVIMFSDGEDHGMLLREFRRDLAGREISVHVIAFGDPKRPTPVRIPTADGGEAPLLFQGRPVMSNADHGTLRDLAAFTNGRFATPDDNDSLEAIFDSIRDKPTRLVATGGGQERRTPLFAWLAAPALLLLISGAGLLPLPRRRNATSMVAILALFVLASCSEEGGRTEVEKGNRALADGDIDVARTHYETAAELLPESPELSYNLGAAAFAAYDTGAADAFFKQALETAPPSLRPRVHYNLAGIRYKQTENALRSFKNADSYLQEAIEHYRDALAIDPTFEDAAYNLELAIRLQDELARRFKVIPGSEGMEEGDARTDDAIETPEGIDPGQVRAAETQQQGEGGSNAREGGQPGGGARKSSQAAGSDSAKDVDLTGASAREMTAEEAEELIELVQGQAGERSERAESRQARMREGSDAPIW